MKLDWSFRPKLADTLKNYSRQDLVSDLIAGLTVGIVALPLALAFATMNGIDVEAAFAERLAQTLDTSLGLIEYQYLVDTICNENVV